VVVLGLILAGCDPEQREPVGLADDPGTPGIGGGGGGGGDDGGTLEPAFFGVWENILLIPVGDDIHTSTTRWRFEPDGQCLQTIATESALEGEVSFESHVCTWRADMFQELLNVTFLATGGTVSYTFSFPTPGLQTLILSDLTFILISTT
jgi:hypothetical protein